MRSGQGREKSDKARNVVTATETLQGLRDRVMPMLEQVAADYAERVPAGYPVLNDAPARGLFGIDAEVLSRWNTQPLIVHITDT